MIGFLDKFTKLPQEFAADIKELKTRRENMSEMVKQMKQMVIRANPPKSHLSTNILKKKPDQYQSLMTTCENHKAFYPEQGYFFVLVKIEQVCHWLSENQQKKVQLQHDQSYQPVHLWVDEEFPHLVKQMRRLQKASKAVESATSAAAKNPSPEKAMKRDQTVEARALQWKICEALMKQNKASPSHHTQCFKAFVQHEYTFAKNAVVQLTNAQAAMKILCTKIEEERKDMVEEMNKKIEKEKEENKDKENTNTPTDKDSRSPAKSPAPSPGN
ncbi:unnamed protein product [Bursaphelenchus okinawaensis]|uniref:Uncharacterized protein n=1 Tax=Bursaphelenchus okinawaensis TaxID=465554 RepID=A0A811JQV4_9BILA|nr:unnamed protein product [Bursaphelenchus okinawaensis]CAG9078514.1 unnamed protein product [Bursaphelenchus okinawaensis]